MEEFELLSSFTVNVEIFNMCLTDDISCVRSGANAISKTPGIWENTWVKPNLFQEEPFHVILMVENGDEQDWAAELVEFMFI